MLVIWGVAAKSGQTGELEGSVCGLTLSGEMGLGIRAFSQPRSLLFTPKMSLC